jgi:hypothetical protein
MLIAKKNGGTIVPSNLRMVCKKCKIAIGEEDMSKINPTIPQIVPVADFLSQKRGENTKFDDGTSANMSHSKLAFLGIIKLDWDEGKTYDPAELIADYKKLGDILHKYKICHRDDVGFKKTPEKKQPEQKEPTSDLCVATTANGQPCTKKAKNGIYCGIHDKNK